jgi:NADH-ubiquinone oxidoreductase chain 4
VAIVVLGLFSNTTIGIEGGIFLSLAHGLVSPALFYLLGGSLYNRFHNRTIRYYRGLSTYIPIFAIFFFIFTIANIAVPLSAN